MSPPEMPGQPLSKNILQVCLGAGGGSTSKHIHNEKKINYLKLRYLRQLWGQ